MGRSRPAPARSWQTETVRRALIAAVLALSASLPAVPLAAQRLRPQAWPPFFACSGVSRNLQARAILEDFYLWYRFLPDVDPARFATPEAYLDAVRYKPLDQSFSAIVPKAAYDALYVDSRYVGFGFSTRATATDLTILQVFPDSSAAEAQLGRGDRIVAVDGRSIVSLAAAAGLDTVFGPAAGGVSVTADVITRAGESRRVTLRKRAVTIPPVSLTRVFQVDGRVVGYVLFHQFVQPSVAALDEAFATLRAAGASELILDLRYNGGGLLDVAVHLASLIGDAATRSQVFVRLQHNDRHTGDDETLRFESAAAPLRLTRLLAITTRASASASEVLINGLRPYLPVVVVGERTLGKPVGQYGFEFCDRVLLAVSFATVNANGEGRYFDGIAPDCPAADDAGADLGAAGEASLAEALHVIRTGGCSSTAAALSASPLIRPAAAPGSPLPINAQ